MNVVSTTLQSAVVPTPKTASVLFLTQPCTFVGRYDADRSGFIDRQELRAALFSLGEDASKHAVDDYMKRYGGSAGMDATQFMSLMLTILGDAVELETIVLAFQVLSLLRAGILEEHMQYVLTDEDIRCVAPF